MTISENAQRNMPFWNKSCTLAYAVDGELRSTTSVIEKEEFIASAPALIARGAVFFVAWTGEWSTGLFTHDLEDLAFWTRCREGKETINAWTKPVRAEKPKARK
jgi:hypothetical protein